MRRWIFCFPALLLMLCLTGCSRLQSGTPGYRVYTTNAERSRLQTENLSSQGARTEEVLAEMFARMKTPLQSGENFSIIPEGVEIVDYSLSDGQLTVIFNDVYKHMNSTSEMLLRAGLVLTVSQLSEVRTVVFHIGDEVLTDNAGEPVGAMTSSMFLNNQIGMNSYKYASLALYFSNRSGDFVVRETRNVHYSSNTTLERVVMEQLLAGPRTEGLLPILSSSVKVLDVSVDDNVCTVNLSKEFLSDRDDKSLLPEVTIYGMVNSLCDVLDVDRVQFQVEGQSNVLYKTTLSLNGPFHRNSDIIEIQDSGSQEVSGTGAEPSVGL